MHSWGVQTHKLMSSFYPPFLVSSYCLHCHLSLSSVFAFILTFLCHECLLSQAVPKKKKDSGRKVLAKIFTQILANCKKADGLDDIWWKVFSVSFICRSCHT